MATRGASARDEEPARRPGEESALRVARDAELARSGWERRFTGAPPRLAEVRELYESLGLEVLLDPVSAEELPEGCGDCRLATSWFQVVYTRRSDRARDGKAERAGRGGGKPDGDEPAPARRSTTNRGSP